MRKRRIVVGMDCGESATITQMANLDRLKLAEHTGDSFWDSALYSDDKRVAGEMSRIILSMCKDNGIGFDQIVSIVLVFPGNRRANPQSTIVQNLRDQWKRRKYTPKILHAMNASLLAVETFYPVKPAVFVSCDTNAYVFARDIKDEYIFAGGWGGMVPDPGSALALAQSVLKYITQVYDKRSINSPFFKEITEKHSIDSPALFHRAIYNNTLDLKKLVDFTFRAADNKDIVATAMLDSSAHNLVDLIRHVVTRLPVSKRIPLLLTGRLLEEEELYRSIVRRKINATLPHITVSPQRFNASECAVQYAIDLVREHKSTKKKT